MSVSPAMSHPRPGVSVSCASVQRLCLSRDTQYLALAAAAASVTRSSERLRFSASLTIHGGAGGRDGGTPWGQQHPCPRVLARAFGVLSGPREAVGSAGEPSPTPSPLVAAAGAPLPRTEVQQLLFGSDDKCFTRMTPVLLLLAKSRQLEEEEEEEDALAPSSYLSAEGVVDTAPYPQLRSVAVAAGTGKHRGWEMKWDRGSPSCGTMDGYRAGPGGTPGVHGVPCDSPCALLTAHPRPGPRSCRPPPP